MNGLLAFSWFLNMRQLFSLSKSWTAVMIYFALPANEGKLTNSNLSNIPALNSHHLSHNYCSRPLEQLVFRSLPWKPLSSIQTEITLCHCSSLLGIPCLRNSSWHENQRMSRLKPKQAWTKGLSPYLEGTREERPFLSTCSVSTASCRMLQGAVCD